MNQSDQQDKQFHVRVKHLRMFVLLFLCLTVLLASLLIRFDAFETFYDYSRHHEDWDLDDIILTIFAMFIAGAVSATFLSLYIIGQIRELARQKIETEHQLVQSRKIQSMGKMLGGVAHSMNNHLQPIITLSRLIKSELPQDSDSARDLDKINEAANNASVMLKRVLNFAHLKRIESGSCEIAPTMESAVQLAKISVPSAITVKQTIDIVPGAIAMTDIDLEIIILNLFNNAISAMGGKQGTIDVYLKQCEKPLTAHKYSQKPWVCVTVSDSGSGMTSDQQKYIFDPFYTSKLVGEGTGLGLSETYGLVSSAGGVIDVVSALEQGTSFKIYLPIISDKGV